MTFPVTVDEPPARGGDGAGAAPLSYFILGAAACLLTQYAKMAILEELSVDSLSMTARAHFERKVEGAFTDIIYDIRISGAENSARIEKLCRDAEGRCYASNTLRKAVPMLTNIEYNGKRLVSLPSRPAST